MWLRMNNRVFAVYALILSLGIALCVIIYAKGGAVLDSSMRLLDRKLPMVEQVYVLKSAVGEQELVLQEYYASGRRDVFQSKFVRRDEKVTAALSMIAENPDYASHIASVRENYANFKQVTQQLDGLLQKGAAGREKGTELLNRINTLGQQTHADLDLLAGVIESEVYQGGRMTEDQINSITRVVVAFCVLLLAIAGFVGYYINAYLSEVEARRKLALFVEKNPNPVLRLKPGGTVDWSNPAAAQMQQAAGKSAPRDLMPPDLPARLQRMRAGRVSYDRWEYEVGELTLGCGIHYLSEFDMYHAYVSNITERTQAERRLAHQAHHDALTGLPNRYLFGEQLQAALDASGETNWPAVLLINLNRFRAVIAGLGHAAGDRLLKLVGRRIQNSLDECRENCVAGTLFRLEADMFCLLVSEAPCPDVASSLARRVEASFAAPFVIEGRELFASVAIGYAIFPRDGRDAITLVKNADAALQKVKQDGGNGILGYSEELNARALERLALETDLRYALERNELALVYQPQVDIADGAVIGSEALLRWRHPARGFVSPAEFIPVAEETGLIIPIGEWILRTACAQVKDWRERGLPPFTVAVNISARQFIQPNFTELVARVIREYDIDPQWIELEITESVAIQSVETTVATLARLKVLGVKLAIDDFGTGYSSLSYLKRFPIDKLKVDQSFVRNLTKDANDAAIARAVIQLGHSLNLKVIAEGVETTEHLARLRDYGCDEIQGYLFSKPLPAADLEKLLRTGKALPRGEIQLRPAA